MHAVTRRAAALVLIGILIALASCGGSANRGTFASGSDSLATAWPGHDWSAGAKSGAYIAVAVDSTERNVDPLTNRLRLASEPDGAGTLVHVYGRDFDSNSIYLHLKYDAGQVHPAETQRGPGLDEDVLFLGVTSQPGVVVLGLTTAHNQPLPQGLEVELAQVRFDRGAMDAPRSISVASTAAPTDVHFVGTNLAWSYNAPGDFDQNSETNIADLTPIGVHLGDSTSDGQHDAADSVVDGDHNGLITIAELTTIGANFLKRTTDYQVQSGASASGPFAEVTGGDVAQNTGTLPSGGGFKTYSFPVPAPQAGAFYSVQVFDGTDGGARSNIVQYGVVSNDAPQNLSASDDGSKITLTWQPPSSGTPDSYNAFVSANSDMSGAVKLNTSAISVTNYDCSPIAVPVGTQHYFAVVAVYSGNPSGYSNIFNYGSGGGGDAPTNLTAAQENTQVRLNWDAPGTVDGYNAYVGSASDLSDAVQMNLGLVSGTTYLCPVAVDPAAEHYFGVKAVVSGNESGFSNICHYQPGGGSDTNPPQWQGGTGIKSVEPDDGFVKIYWYPAIDQTPPVSYLIYFSPEGTPIDWNNPTDVVDSSQTSYTVLGLTNGQRYEFGVRAEDAVTPTPNVTTNTNTLFATPMVFPSNGAINGVTSSDTASIRMPGEEIPRVVSVSHSGDLTYTWWNGTVWQSLDLNAALIHDAARKYHPQLVAVGNEVHILYATSTGVYEISGDKDSDPASWNPLPKSIASGLNGVFGTGFAYDEANGYLACVYGANVGGNDHLYYTDRDTASATWNTPQSICDPTGGDQVWQCDFCISPFDGSQWVVAAVGTADSSGDNLKFWAGHRANRTDALTVSDTGKRGDVMVVDIDPTTTQPVVVNAEVHDVDTDGGPQPVSDAAVYDWNGSSWITPPGSPIEQGDASFDTGSLTAHVELTGQDPQLVFSPSGKAVALWSRVIMDVDYSNYPDITIDITGKWERSSKNGTGFGAAEILMPQAIVSSNSVTAGEGYKHCITCFVGASDSGTDTEILAKYSTRNDYPEGDLYYRRDAWQ